MRHIVIIPTALIEFWSDYPYALNPELRVARVVAVTRYAARLL